jgi:hypothetical protein
MSQEVVIRNPLDFNIHLPKEIMLDNQYVTYKHLQAELTAKVLHHHETPERVKQQIRDYMH